MDEHREIVERAELEIEMKMEVGVGVESHPRARAYSWGGYGERAEEAVNDDYVRGVYFGHEAGGGPD